MKLETYNKIEKNVTIGFVGILFIIFLIGITINMIGGAKERAIEFDKKYKPVCDSLGGIYQQEGNYRNNWCYINYNGILRKGCMIQINEQWELVEC